MLTFDVIRQILSDAVKDPDFVRKNTLMQDSAMAKEMQYRISSLTPDLNITLDWSNVESSAGVLFPDPATKALVFDPLGSGNLLSNYREGVITSPGKIWARVPAGSPSPTDRSRYLITDSSRGVLLVDENLQVISMFPGYVTGVPVTGYADPGDAITFTYLGVEYVAVAMPSHHIVRIFELASGNLYATIGSVDLPGVPPL